jgi:pimeloyl-ACP methyl ester carboxylesterase
LHGDGRSSVQQRLADTIEREAPQMVIAHSLGSVVAYDTLWRNPHLQVDVLVTIGSPLAMPDVVFPHLHHDRTGPKGARPPAATAWVNVADPGDVVAIPQPLTDWFDGVTTNVRTGIGAFSTHKAANYLKNRDTAQALQGFLEKPAP